MELTIKLQPADYLIFQLFTASRSDTIRKRRKMEWLLTTVFFAVLASIFILAHILLLFYYFMGVALLCLAFYPKYSARRYKKHYRRHIRDVNSNAFGKTVHIKFTDEFIITSDRDSEAKINLNQIKEVNETGTHFFVMLLSGTALIIPKSFCADVQLFKNYLETLCEKRQVKYNAFTEWKWR